MLVISIIIQMYKQNRTSLFDCGHFILKLNEYKIKFFSVWLWLQFYQDFSYKPNIICYMSEIQQTREQPTEVSTNPKSITLSVKHPSLINQKFPLNPKQSLAQLKQYLADTTPLYLYENFHFQSNGNLVPQYVELDTVFEGDSGDIDVVLDHFDERTSKYHVKKVSDLIKNPSIWSTLSNKDIEPKNKEDSLKIKQKQLDIQFVLQPNLQSPYFDSKEERQLKESLVFLNFSGYNPPPSYRKLAGDFYYLHLRVLESIDYHITANAKGFYINNSNMNYFDPESHPQYKGIYSNLLNLLKSISPKFKKSFEESANDNSMTEVQKISLMSKYASSNCWLANKKQTQHSWSGNSVQSQTVDSSAGIKDWNEMFQAHASLPAQTHVQKLNKTKLFVKIYTDFIGAATEGAKNLIDGKMAPLNPLDPKQQHIYIHNSIFYSIAQETPYDYSQQKGLQATPTVTAINTDLNNLQRVLNLNIPELHVLHMVLIDYRGYRVIAQCIIPGILSAEQLQCSQYGSIDDGKTIQNNKEFEYLMSQVCDKLDLDSNVEFIDEKGEKKKIAGNLDIKGILGNDKRKYLLDLMRLSPRDYNYLGDENHSCVLRSELIQLYKEFLNQPKQINQYNTLLQKKLECPINTNLETGIEFVKNQLTERQQKQLKDMALFLRQRCIPKFIEAMQTTQRKNLADSKSIVTILHKFGINSRYLGEIASHELLADQPHLKLAFQRVILVKSLKHLFRIAMRDSSPLHLSGVLSRLLNCVFGTRNQLQNLQNNKDIQSSVLIQQNKIQKTQEKGKKKSKNNKSKVNMEQKVEVTDLGDGGIEPLSSNYMTIKPSEVWETIKKLALARYSHKFPENITQFKGFSLPFNKLAALRDLCLSIGLLIQRKNYDLFSQKQEQMPFQPRNIIQLQPISKHISLKSQQITKMIETADSLLASLKIQQAIEMYNNSVQYLIGLYGGLHEDIASVHHKIATIYYKLTDYQAAIACERNSFELLKLMFGQDNTKTIQSITNLGLFYFSKGDKQKALYYLFKSMFLSNLSFGEGYPQVVVNYMNLSAIYQQSKQYQQTIVCLLECLDRVEIIYGKNNMNTAACYTALATIHYEISDMRQCVEYQQKSVQSLKNSLKQNDQRLLDAQNLLAYYKQTFSTKKIQPVQQKKVKKQEQKVQIRVAEQQPQMSTFGGDKSQNGERAILLRKLQQAKWNARAGHR